MCLSLIKAVTVNAEPLKNFIFNNIFAVKCTIAIRETQLTRLVKKLLMFQEREKEG